MLFTTVNEGRKSGTRIFTSTSHGVGTGTVSRREAKRGGWKERVCSVVFITRFF